MERDAKRIADDLKNMPAMCIHGGLQDGVVALAQRLPLIGVFLRKFGRALNVCEEESDCACRNRYTASNLNDLL